MVQGGAIVLGAFALGTAMGTVLGSSVVAHLASGDNGDESAEDNDGSAEDNDGSAEDNDRSAEDNDGNVKNASGKKQKR